MGASLPVGAQNSVSITYVTIPDLSRNTKVILSKATALIKKKDPKLELCCPFEYSYVSNAIFLIIKFFSNIAQLACSNIERQQMVKFENFAASTCLNC